MFRLNSVPLPTLSQRSAMAAIHSIAAQSFLSLPNPKPRKRIAAHPKPILTSKLPKNPTFPRNKQKGRRVLNSAVKREECDVIPVQSSDSTDQQEGVVASRVESEAGDQGELVSQVGGFGASEGRLSFEGAGGFGSTGVGSERESEEFERPVEKLLTNIPSRYSSASLNRSSASLNRSSFPSGFVFGSASASYQYEGAWNEGGKGPSIWDNFTHQYPEKISDGSNGDVANDQYHRYKEDVKIMKDMGLDAYRFSISWSRLLPNGKLSGGVSKEGVQYYNNLINELQNKGIAPYVTIFHWDLPQALEEEYGGFLNRQIVNHFRDYAELCFKLFGDRVKHWITLNEPYNFINFGYASGQLAPGRCSAWQNLNCTGGDSATEPYIVAHHFLLAHAHAVEVYKTKYQASQEGVIGITLAANWFVPISNETRHQDAANRSLDFMFGWFMEPLTSGQYPHSMQVLVKERLPKFTEEESKLIKGSFDFVGMNYYTTHYSSDQPDNNSANPSFLTDACVFESTELNGVPIGPPAASSWLVIYPKGIREILLYAKHKYNNPVIYITENGMDEFDDPKLSLSQSLNDTHRIYYHYHHLDYLRKAIDDGVNVKGYFAWSLTDNFEWAAGYTLRFGLVYIDYNDGLKRHPKLSASWFKYFLG